MRLNMGFMARVWGKPQTFSIPGEGYYDDRGRWIPAEPQEIAAVATILPLTSIDLQFYEGGAYTTEDVKVIVNGAINLPIGATFERNGVAYEIREARDYAEVADLRRYVGKRLREVEP